MMHPSQPGTSHQFNSVQVSDVMMMSHELLLIIVQATASAAADNGNWTLENAKGRLFMFLQQTRQPRDICICPAGPDYNRYYILAISNLSI